MKLTTSLHLKLRLKPAFLVCFCYFWKDKSLLVTNLVIPEYLDQIPPWKEMKDAFSVNLLTERIWSNRGICKEVRFVPNTVGGIWAEMQTQEWKFCYFFPSFKLTQNCYINIFLFLENWQFNHKLCPPLS